ncbi:MAG: hypothetical protein KAI66_15820 [Lentisphaeria bacterium]|nr:hypothetical protein [Lentisphaeria bacterium]
MGCYTTNRVPMDRHGSRVNVSLCDGHVESMQARKLIPFGTPSGQAMIELRKLWGH